jgi:radical SAM protein with 4Fe4S-binding SPASM domain
MPFECAQNAGLGEPSLAELIVLKAEARRVPLNVHFELTYRCNEQCVHCYCVVEHGREREVRPLELTTGEVMRVLDDLAELGAFYLTLSGGEVLVRSDFFDIAAHAQRRGFAYRIFTNGIGLTEEKARRLAEVEPLTVEVSLLSADPAVHDAITRVPGSFRRLMRSIELLRRYGLRVHLKSVIMKPNLAGFPALHALGRELERTLGVATHTFSCEVSPRIDGDLQAPRRHQLDDEELFQYVSQPVFEQSGPYVDGPPEQVAKLRQSCGPAVNGCAIDPYGNVFPCVAFKIPLGNLRDVSFKELWSAPPPAIQELIDVKTYADLGECRTCELVGYCKRCHGDNLMERGGHEWKSCHEQARSVAKAERRLYQIRMSERSRV